jgi:hypothetical protein
MTSSSALNSGKRTLPPKFSVVRVLAISLGSLVAIHKPRHQRTKRGNSTKRGIDYRCCA